MTLVCTAEEGLPPRPLARPVAQASPQPATAPVPTPTALVRCRATLGVADWALHTEIQGCADPVTAMRTPCSGCLLPPSQAVCMPQAASCRRLFKCAWPCLVCRCVACVPAAVCVPGYGGPSCALCHVGAYSVGGPKETTTCQACNTGFTTPSNGSSSSNDCTGESAARNPNDTIYGYIALQSVHVFLTVHVLSH